MSTLSEIVAQLKVNYPKLQSKPIELPLYQLSNDEYNLVVQALEQIANGSVTIDSELDSDSTNPLQNKVIAALINNINNKAMTLQVAPFAGIEESGDAKAQSSSAVSSVTDVYFFEDDGKFGYVTDTELSPFEYYPNWGNRLIYEDDNLEPYTDKLYLDVSTQKAYVYVGGALVEINKMTIDGALSSTSENPVQNKVIKAAMDSINTVVASAVQNASSAAASASNARASAAAAAEDASDAADEAESASNRAAAAAASSAAALTSSQSSQAAATNAAASAESAASALQSILDAINELDPSVSTEDAIAALAAQVSALLAVVNSNTSEIAELKEDTNDVQEQLDERKQRTIPIGFTGVDKDNYVMSLSDGSVVWNSQGNANNRCATVDVSAGDIIYIDPYTIGSYNALSWCILDANDNVTQQAPALVPAGQKTPPYRIAVTTGGTLYVYVQQNIDIPIIRKVVNEDYDTEMLTAAVKNTSTFALVTADVEITTSVYISNSTLIKGYAIDQIFSGGNSNNGLYHLSVNRGDVYKICKANLGGYGGLYWTIINSDGIVQHGEGRNSSVSDDVIVVCKASGTLYVSFGYYDSTAGKYIRPTIHKLEDLNARYMGVQSSLKTLFGKSLLEECPSVTDTDSAYAMVESNALSIGSAGNSNNGYLALALSSGDFVKVTGLGSSSYANVSWVLARADGSIIDYSGVIGYQETDDDISIIAAEDATLYVNYGYYDVESGAYPKPIIFTPASSGDTLNEHSESIDTISKTLFRQYVAFDGFEAPMIIRYNNSTSLILDTSLGNSLNRCYHVAVTKGEKFLIHKARTGGYDGVAWAVFAGGVAVQQSSERTYANMKFGDEVFEVEQDGTLYVDNFQNVDDDLCELYKIDEDELVGNGATKPITLCGDSTMQGLGSALTSSMLANPRRIYKMAVGSENVFATAARMGAIPLLVMPFTIPADTTAVEISVTPRPLFKQTYDAYGVPETPAVQNSYVSPSFVNTEHFYCSIGGIEGDIYTTSGTTYFKRIESGTALTIGVPTEVVPTKVKRVRNSLLVCLMGTNGGYLNYDADYNADDSQWGSQTASQRAQNLFDVMKRMFAYMGGEMVVIGFFCGESQAYFTKAFYEEYERLCEHEFGERFVNARIWLKDYCWQKLGLTLTSTDKAYMAAGYPPVQLFYDGQAVHLNSEANAVFAQYIADRISNLGY